MNVAAPSSLLLLLQLLLLASLAAASTSTRSTVGPSVVNISNVQLRHDVRGEAMDIHDGSIITHTDPTTGEVEYLYYGMGYQNCTIQHSWFPPHWCPGIYQPFGQCGFRTDHAVRLYASKDLANWTLRSSNVFPVATRPYGIYFRAKVVFCCRTGLYVLWLNYLPNASSPLAAYPTAELLVATSSTVDGPFAFESIVTGLAHAGAGDFTLMVHTAPSNEAQGGTDDVAYVAYGSWSTEHSLAIELLNENFTNSLGLRNTSGIITPPGNEAPILFERQGWFYLLFGECCCFCQQGAATRALVSSSPLGPWQPLGSCANATAPVDLNPLQQDGHRIIPSQNDYVFRIPRNSSSSAADGDSYVWMGDRWASALDGIFGHTLQSWHALHFHRAVDSPADAPPCIEALTWQDWFLLSV